MGIPNAIPVRFTPRGVVDAFDATDKFPGACRQLTNLVFDESNPELVVSRPGVTTLVDFHDSVEFGDVGVGFISVFAAIGTRVYGMVLTGRYSAPLPVGFDPALAVNAAGGYYYKDEPFCYDTEAQTFIPIGDVTTLNTPYAPNDTGPWVPPTMAVVGRYVIVTHPGYTNQPKYLWQPTSGGTVPPGAMWTAHDTMLWGSIEDGGSGILWGTVALGGSGEFWGEQPLWGDRYTFGVFDNNTDTTIRWFSTTTFPNTLTDAPTAVVNFSNRAYFAVKQYLEYTDVLSLLRTRASQQVTVGDTQDIVAMSGLPVQTTGSGMLQTMTIFKRNQIWQLGGDEATWNMSLSYTSLNVGTYAPRTLVQSPYGLYFISDGGPYFLDLLGTLRAVTHSMNELEPDVITAFMTAQDPSRWTAGYNSGIYRVAGVGLFPRGIIFPVDYWFDEHRRRWTGPHSFQYDCTSPFGADFILSTRQFAGQLILSPVQQRRNFVNTDLDIQIGCNLISATFPKTDWMTMKQVVESQIELGATNGSILYNIYAQDEQGHTLGNVALTVESNGSQWGMGTEWADGTLWGVSNIWGGGSAWGPRALFWGDTTNLWLGFQNYWTDIGGSGLFWGLGGQNVPQTFPVPWTQPVVFEKMMLRIDVISSNEVAIGTFYARYQKTGYMTFGLRG